MYVYLSLNLCSQNYPFQNYPFFMKRTVGSDEMYMMAHDLGCDLPR